MVNFSIMTLDEEHIDEVCEDIADRSQLAFPWSRASAT